MSTKFISVENTFLRRMCTFNTYDRPKETNHYQLKMNRRKETKVEKNNGRRTCEETKSGLDF